MEIYVVKSPLMHNGGKGFVGARIDQKTGVILRAAVQGQPYLEGDEIELSDDEAKAIIGDRKSGVAIDLKPAPAASAPPAGDDQK